MRALPAMTFFSFQSQIENFKQPYFLFTTFEKNHQFVEKDGKNYRQNEIWREIIDRRTGNKTDEELLVKNFAEVKYELNFAPQECNL